jgi:S1-C subfamily serine protease
MSESLKSLSTALADVVESAADFVVRVEGRRRLAASGIVWASEGLIITANHVVKRDEGIRVGFGAEEIMTAEVVGRDPTTDLAVLKVDRKIDSKPDWQDEGELRVGHIILALGRPGTSIQATLGVISALGPGWRTPAGGELTRYFQTDVVMYPGFSGGPLVNVSGEFVGLNTSSLVRGVSMTIPTGSLQTITKDLIEYGHIRRGYLGVSLQIVRLPESLAVELGQNHALLIAGIEEGSPAEQSELYQGDILISAGEFPLRHMDDLFVQLRSDKIGKKLPFRIIRAGELLEVVVKIGARKW